MSLVLTCTDYDTVTSTCAVQEWVEQDSTAGIPPLPTVEEAILIATASLLFWSTVSILKVAFRNTR